MQRVTQAKLRSPRRRLPGRSGRRLAGARVAAARPGRDTSGARDAHGARAAWPDAPGKACHRVAGLAPLALPGLPGCEVTRRRRPDSAACAGRRIPAKAAPPAAHLTSADRRTTPHGRRKASFAHSTTVWTGTSVSGAHLRQVELAEQGKLLQEDRAWLRDRSCRR